MKIVQLVAVIAQALVAAIQYIQRHKSKQRQTEYERDVEQIENDPAGYARDRFGVSDTADKDTDTLHSNPPAGSDDPRT